MNPVNLWFSKDFSRIIKRHPESPEHYRDQWIQQIQYGIDRKPLQGSVNPVNLWLSEDVTRCIERHPEPPQGPVNPIGSVWIWSKTITGTSDSSKILLSGRRLWKQWETSRSYKTLHWPVNPMDPLWFGQKHYRGQCIQWMIAFCDVSYVCLQIPTLIVQDVVKEHKQTSGMSSWRSLLSRRCFRKHSQTPRIYKTLQGPMNPIDPLDNYDTLQKASILWKHWSL